MKKRVDSTAHLRWQRRKKVLRKRMAVLIAALGGRCAQCGKQFKLTIHHVQRRDPKRWTKPAREYAWYQRLNIYEQELREGVALSCLCHFCNSSHPDFGTTRYKEIK